MEDPPKRTEKGTDPESLSLLLNRSSAPVGLCQVKYRTLSGHEPFPPTCSQFHRHVLLQEATVMPPACGYETSVGRRPQPLRKAAPACASVETSQPAAPYLVGRGLPLAQGLPRVRRRRRT